MTVIHTERLWTGGRTLTVHTTPYDRTYELRLNLADGPAVSLGILNGVTVESAIHEARRRADGIRFDEHLAITRDAE